MFMAISFLVFEGKESLLSQFSLAYPIRHVFKKIVFKATLPIHKFQVLSGNYLHIVINLSKACHHQFSHDNATQLFATTSTAP